MLLRRASEQPAIVFAAVVTPSEENYATTQRPLIIPDDAMETHVGVTKRESSLEPDGAILQPVYHIIYVQINKFIRESTQLYHEQMKEQMNK